MGQKYLPDTWISPKPSAFYFWVPTNIGYLGLDTWRIGPQDSVQWLITMISNSPKDRNVGPLPFMAELYGL